MERRKKNPPKQSKQKEATSVGRTTNVKYVNCICRKQNRAICCHKCPVDIVDGMPPLLGSVVNAAEVICKWHISIILSQNHIVRFWCEYNPRRIWWRCIDCHSWLWQFIIYIHHYSINDRTLWNALRDETCQCYHYYYILLLSLLLLIYIFFFRRSMCGFQLIWRHRERMKVCFFFASFEIEHLQKGGNNNHYYSETTAITTNTSILDWAWRGFLATYIYIGGKLMLKAEGTVIATRHDPPLPLKKKKP